MVDESATTIITFVTALATVIVPLCVVYLATSNIREKARKLSPCTDCGKQISKRATTCPNCGAHRG